MLNTISLREVQIKPQNMVALHNTKTVYQQQNNGKHQGLVRKQKIQNSRLLITGEPASYRDESPVG